MQNQDRIEKVLAWSTSQNVPARDKLVLIHLSLQAAINDIENLTFTDSQSNIANRCGYSRITIISALKSLEHKHGLIRGSQDAMKNGRRTQKKYQILMPSALR